MSMKVRRPGAMRRCTTPQWEGGADFAYLTVRAAAERERTHSTL